MSTKRLLALLVCTPFIVSGVALADPPNLCPEEDFTTSGGYYQVEKAEHGTPGNQINTTKKEPELPADEFAQDRAEARYTEDCPPPGTTAP